jgi:peptidyl-prolyl cis-trans isomerase SurA
MEEFAQRANLTADQLIAELDKVGISAETFRDFVSAGLPVAQGGSGALPGTVPVSENDVDLALEAATRPGSAAGAGFGTGYPGARGRGRGGAAGTCNQPCRSTIRSEGAFAARRHRSIRPPRPRTGRRLDWVPLSNLPGCHRRGGAGAWSGRGVRAACGSGRRGAVHAARSWHWIRPKAPIQVTVEWAEFLLPNDPAEEIARLRAEVDVCYDLNAQAKGLAGRSADGHDQPASEIPSDVALELSRLDPGESSVALTRGGSGGS